MVATGGNRSQIAPAAKPREQAKTVPAGCDRLPKGAGKEGSTFRVRQRALRSPCCSAPSVAPIGSECVEQRDGVFAAMGEVAIVAVDQPMLEPRLGCGCRLELDQKFRPREAGDAEKGCRVPAACACQTRLD